MPEIPEVPFDPDFDSPTGGALSAAPPRVAFLFGLALALGVGAIIGVIFLLSALTR